MRCAEMRFLTFEECAKWCEARGYPLTSPNDKFRVPDVEEQYSQIELPYPLECGKRVYVASRVIDRSLKYGHVLLWISDWAVWPSSQHMPLFTRFRESLGEMRPLIEAPGHLLDSAEREDGVSVLATALLFSWDCYVLRADGGPFFYCSHDEWNSVFAPPGHSPEEFALEFSDWGDGPVSTES